MAASTERPADLGVRVACALLLAGAGLGAVLRFAQIFPVAGLHQGNAVHAHSHTLYFGWGGLALFALMLERLRAPRGPMRAVTWGLAALGAATLPVFLVDGYGRGGVLLSAGSLVPFGAAAVVAWRASGGASGRARSFFRLGVAFVATSYVAALSRVVLKVAQVDAPVVGAIAVHLFLGCFGAFFVAALMGLLLRGGDETAPELRWVLRLLPLTPLASLVVVPGVDDTPLGPVARLAAVLTVVPATAWLRWAWARDGVLRSVAIAWWVSVALVAAAALKLLPSLPAQRHAVVAVVHLQTLGVVTTGLLWLIEQRREVPRLLPVAAHQAAASVLLAGLGVAALGAPRVGLWLAAIGGGLTWATQAWGAARAIRR